MPYFGEPLGRVKIQTTRLVICIMQHVKLICSWERISWIFIHRECVVEVCEAAVNGIGAGNQAKSSYWSMAGNLSNRSSGVQIPRDICTRLKGYLYSAKCSWIINNEE